jgi:Lrp/AsnC family transcriptional regulator, regulator for asnA, asnC and gidA
VARTLDTMIDETDVAILEILQRDGRAPYSVIARTLDLPESTVRLRCRRIFEAGLVSVVATGDPLRWGIPVDAIHLVKVEPSRIDAVADALVAMPTVRYVGVTLGGGVLIVESLHGSAEELHAFLVHQVPALPGVKEVESHQIVDIRTSVWDWRAWLHTAGAHPAPGEAQRTASPAESTKENR